MQIRLNSLVQRGIMRIGRRYRVARSSTEEVDAEISWIHQRKLKRYRRGGQRITVACYETVTPWCGYGYSKCFCFAGRLVRARLRLWDQGRFSMQLGWWYSCIGTRSSVQLVVDITVSGQGVDCRRNVKNQFTDWKEAKEPGGPCGFTCLLLPLEIDQNGCIFWAPIRLLGITALQHLTGRIILERCTLKPPTPSWASHRLEDPEEAPCKGPKGLQAIVPGA